MIKETVDHAIKQKHQKTPLRIHSALILFALAVVVSSCDTKRVYEDFYAAKTGGWNKDSVALFVVDIKDTTNDYNILINCRNLENYPYSNLWLFVDIISPDSMAIRDTLEYQLAYPNGKWIGKGTSGVYENQFAYRSHIFFPRSGNYQFKIQQGMRDNKLKGLKDIGIRIETNN